MDHSEFSAFNGLYRAAKRLVPDAKAIGVADLSDREIVNLTTTVDALRQFAQAVNAAAAEIEPHLAPPGNGAPVFREPFPTMG